MEELLKTVLEWNFERWHPLPLHAGPLLSYHTHSSVNYPHALRIRPKNVPVVKRIHALLSLTCFRNLQVETALKDCRFGTTVKSPVPLVTNVLYSTSAD